MIEARARPPRRTDRRRVLGALGAGCCLLVLRPALATPAELQAALRERFGAAPITRGRVAIVMPVLAESGNVVPVAVRVDSPMTADDHVTGIHLFAEKNQLPEVLDIRLGPWNGKAEVASRIRLATSQQILAVAVMSDGSIWSGATEVEVTVSGCGW